MNNGNIFIVPTGWCKTEKIAEEIVNKLSENNNKKLLVILQNKEAINRLKARINEKSENRLEVLENNGWIYYHISEEKDEKFNSKIKHAKIIISHHYYFKNAGDVLTFYKASFDILSLNPDVIIDEAHTFIELMTRLDLNIGALFEKRMARCSLLRM